MNPENSTPSVEPRKRKSGHLIRSDSQNVLQDAIGAHLVEQCGESSNVSRPSANPPKASSKIGLAHVRKPKGKPTKNQSLPQNLLAVNSALGSEIQQPRAVVNSELERRQQYILNLLRSGNDELAIV
jgi:hypothetical protein